MTIRWTFDSRDAAAATTTRRALFAYLKQRGVASRSDFASSELVYAELVGNVVRHAPGRVDVSLDWSETQAVLTVADEGSGFPLAARLPGDRLSESGRGLFLVCELANAVDVEHIPDDGTRVRARLNVFRATT